MEAPIFSDDMAGFLRLLASLGATAAAVIYGFWKIMSSKLTRDGEDRDKAIDGLGGRVDLIGASDTRAHTRIDDLIRRADAKDIEVREATGNIARLEAKVDQMLTQGTDNKLEIIGEFQKAANEVRSGLHELDVKVERMSATMEERDRVRNAA